MHVLQSYPQFFKFFSDFDEAYMQFSSEMICESAVIIVEAEVSRAHLTHTQLLLLETGRGHGVAVDVLCLFLQSACLLHLLQHLLGLVHVPLAA